MIDMGYGERISIIFVYAQWSNLEIVLVFAKQ